MRHGLPAGEALLVVVDKELLEQVERFIAAEMAILVRDKLTEGLLRASVQNTVVMRVEGELRSA
jgi:hypothetical protein